MDAKKKEELIQKIKVAARSLMANDAIVDTVYPHKGEGDCSTYEILCDALEILGVDSFDFETEALKDLVYKK